MLRVFCKSSQYIFTSNHRLRVRNVCYSEHKPCRGKESIVPVEKDEALRFYCECLQKAGVSDENAKNSAEVFLWGDYCGKYRYGIYEFERTLNALSKGLIDGSSTPEIVKETDNTAWVKGNNSLGPVVGTFCIDLAINKTIESSISWVAASCSNTFGLSTWYTMRAVNNGLIGLAITNSFPVLSPTGSSEKGLGLNPIALAAPAKSKDYFSMYLSMSNTKPSEDPLREKKLWPLGGELMGHKGYGLAIAAEILSSILSDATFGPNITPPESSDNPANLGHAFGCINPQCFAPDFHKRLKTFIDYIRGMEPSDPKAPVKVAGDLERMVMEKADSLGGIAYKNKHLEKMKHLAENLDVEPMKEKE